MRRILFVDDEQGVLDGLRDLLRKQRKQWDMVFALGGQAALVELEKAPFDVVVSDMRMPGVDGAALLAKVKEQHPATARIILSGQSDRESVMKAVAVAHQFLSKPCEPEVLREIVERTCQLQSLLQNECVRAVVGKLDKLPSAPRMYFELTQAAGSPGVTMGDLGAIVEQDPAMSVKVLQLVNSAYFGLAQRQTSVRQAAAFLGTDLLKGLALTVHAFGSVPPPPIAGFSLEAIQKHSLLTARVAKQLFPGPKRAGEIFTASVVHDVGKIILATSVPDGFAEAIRVARTTGAPSFRVEKELLGLTHAEVGGYLLGFWGLPLPIVEVVAYHHTPSLAQDAATEVLSAVHVADALVHLAGGGRSVAESNLLDLAFVERVGLAPDLPRLLALAEAEVIAAEGAS